MQIRDAQDYVQILEEQLHERANHIASMALQSQPPAAPLAPPQASTSAPASPMHGTVVYSTTLNVPPTTTSEGVKTCKWHHAMPGTGGRMHMSAPREHLAQHGPEMPQHASLHSSVGQPSAATTACACPHPQCVHGHVARVPLTETLNIPAVHPSTAFVHQCPPHVSDNRCSHSQSLAPSGHYQGRVAQDRADFALDVFSGRYRSTALMRMQRLQDRLKASERDLSYRLGRLLGGENDVQSAHGLR